jgi:hypothetical protein
MWNPELPQVKMLTPERVGADNRFLVKFRRELGVS